jgi:hypothetical protein
MKSASWRDFPCSISIGRIVTDTILATPGQASQAGFLRKIPDARSPTREDESEKNTQQR